jgi:hypothetical protein
MFELTIFSSLIYGFSVCIFYYLIVSGLKRKFVPIHCRKLLFYITIFCLFGLAGEVFVNNIWEYIFGSPLWEYRLFPAHGGDVSYFFPLIWGALGFYKYVNDTAIHRFKDQQHIKPGMVMGTEAVLIEIVYNGLFLWLFGSYIFYYLPANMGPLSHLSCWQVIPFYFMVGFFINELIVSQNKAGYRNRVLLRICFYWMVIGALILF